MSTPDATQDAVSAAASAPPHASVRDLNALRACNADSAQLLAILQELRDSVGPKVVNNAIAKVMQPRVPDAPHAPPGLPQEPTKAPDKPQRTGKPSKKKAKREFRMSNYASRSVAVKFLYAGEPYAGFARQDHMPETVEAHLLAALVRAKLIDDVDSAHYSRCGRTDRGVSAFGQVVALRVRSNLPANAKLLSASSIDAVRPGSRFQVRLAGSSETKTLTEVDYATHMNRALPSSIRVYAVVACTPEFSARFDCQARLYRYFFVRGDLDVELMQHAAQQLVGKHDFRNFCRIDPNCHVYERRVHSFTLAPCSGLQAQDPKQQLFQCEIRGRAFLWHQVRCMMAVLFLVGAGKEAPEVVTTLLDVERTPRKPQYALASDLPLVLHDCEFPDPDDASTPGPRFESTPLALLQVQAQLSADWEKRSVQAAVLRSHLDALEDFTVDARLAVEELDHYAPKLELLMRERGLLGDQGGRTRVKWKELAPLLPLCKQHKLQPLGKRDTGHSVDERKRKMAERKRRRDQLAGPENKSEKKME